MTPPTYSTAIKALTDRDAVDLLLKAIAEVQCRADHVLTALSVRDQEVLKLRLELEALKLEVEKAREHRNDADHGC